MSSPEPPAPSRDASKTQGGELSPGQKVGGGRFCLVKLLGRGGMGVVWLAQDERLGEPVALKMLPPEIRADLVALDDMRRETLKSRKLSHPNIVRLHDLCETEGEAAFISMEFVDGPNLVALRLEQPARLFGWDFLQPIVKQLCEALDYAHGEKVVHRDLKPGNMMLDRRGRLMLADFGIAAVVCDSVSRVSLRSLTSGTPTYMSPQQMQGQAPRPADDIYALGATLYELLTSRPPFYTGDIAHQVINLPPQPMAERLAELELVNDIPADVAALVMACLAKDPAQRPQSVRAVAEWIGLAPAVEPGLTHLSQSVGAVAEEPEVALVEEPAPGNKLGMALAGVLVLVLVITGGFVLFRRSATSGTKANTKTETATKARPVAGTLDGSFDPGGGLQGEAHGVSVQADGKIVVVGNFSAFSGVARNSIVRLNADGSLDTTCAPSAPGTVHDMVMQGDGRLLIVGDFGKVNGERRGAVARLNPDLTLDQSFTTGSGAVQEIRCAALQPDGKVVIGGNFVSFDGKPHARLARLSSSGSLDLRFKPSVNLTVWCVAVQPDNEILLGGAFDGVNGHGSTGIARLYADGTFDTRFKPQLKPASSVRSVAVQADGRVLVGGGFTNVNGLQRTRIVRLNPDGSVDQEFNAGNIPGGGVRSIKPLADGRILIAGAFTNIAGQTLNGVARLNADGSLDPQFTKSLRMEGSVWTAAVQQDGRIIVVGRFSQVDGVERGKVARLHGD